MKSIFKNVALAVSVFGAIGVQAAEKLGAHETDLVNKYVYSCTAHVYDITDELHPKKIDSFPINVMDKGNQIGIFTLNNDFKLISEVMELQQDRPNGAVYYNDIENAVQRNKHMVFSKYEYKGAKKEFGFINMDTNLHMDIFKCTKAKI